MVVVVVGEKVVSYCVTVESGECENDGVVEWWSSGMIGEGVVGSAVA